MIYILSTICKASLNSPYPPDMYTSRPLANNNASSNDLTEIYKRIKGVGIEADEILERLYIAIGGQDFRLDSARALGVYAVTSYFFDNCDIFEDPYAASQSMTLPHGHDAQMVQGVFDDFAN